jgi:SHS2 domain-containing protein
VYRWVDHTAEVELEIEAAGEREVFADALAALADLLAAAGEGVELRAVELRAADRPALLAAWLEELVFLAETEGFEPLGVESLELDDDSLRATIRGRLGAPPHLVKAVTYHRLAFTPTGSGYSARVVLDV